jgi:membrane protein DedA with SNARE-associated domain
VSLPVRPRFVLVALGALLIPIVPFLIVGELPGERWLAATGGHALAFGATGGLLLMGDVLLPIPSSVIGSLLGARLGALAGFSWAFAGLTGGAWLGYAVGRLVPGRATAGISRPTAWVVLVSRPVPVLAEAAALAAGAARTSPLAFLLATTAGNGIYAGVLALAGARIVPAGLASPALAVPLLVPVIAFLIWRRRSRGER